MADITSPYDLNNTASDLGLLAQRLHALLASTYGDRGENFRMLDDSLQDSFMWQCSIMARELSTKLNAMDFGEIPAKEACHV
jgi:hypothetical protein